MAAADGNQISPYQLLGGETAVRRLVERFYFVMDEEPRVSALRAMHAPDLGPMSERLFDFLSGWLGGPPRYFQRADAKCMGSAHAGFAIDQAIGDQWMYCMLRALEDTEASQEAKDLMIPALRRMATAFRNR